MKYANSRECAIARALIPALAAVAIAPVAAQDSWLNGQGVPAYYYGQPAPSSPDAPVLAPAERWSGEEPEVKNWLYGGRPDSLGGRASILIGGEAFVDLTYKSRDRARTFNPATGFEDARDGRQRRTDFEATTANLRFLVTPTTAPNVKLHLKLSLDDAWNRGGDIGQDDLLEECRFVFEDIMGSGWSLLFGKGEVPFGQDRTLGIIQSYAHNADSYVSSEGYSSLLADPDWVAGAAGQPVGRAGRYDSLPHPGEIDRVFFAGASYRWRERLQAEFAVFQNDRRVDHRRSADGMQSFAARLWWTPVENLTLQLSGLRRHSRLRGHGSNRPDLASPGDARAAEYALSFGVEWTPGPWEFWTEYIHGWNWNNTRGHSTDMVSLGGRFNFNAAWSAGLMGEFMRLRDPRNGMRREDYYKLVAGVKYTMPSGMFLMGEVGGEWFRGRYTDWRNWSANATLFAIRMGWRF